MYVIKVVKPTIAKLTNQPKDSSNVTAKEKIFLPQGTALTIVEVLDHKDKHIQVVILPSVDNKPIKDKVTAWLFLDHIDSSKLPDDLFYILPLDKLIAIVGNTAKATLYHEGLNVALVEFKINTPKRIASFLAQVCHESAGFIYAEEIASGIAYEGRKDLGNVYGGDGKRFKGRGLIQLTGRHNYDVCGKALGLDLINFPKKASEPINAPRIAAWYWNSRNLNKYADMHNVTAFQEITKRINGGLNGYKDRLNWWSKARKVLGC